MSCITPFYRRDTYSGVHAAFPCGKCPPCLKRRASGWSFRLMEEEKNSFTAYFITLTYANENVPMSPNGYMSLKKRDVQLFFKRLRKASPDFPRIRYYVCGEYGTDTYRPHYHAIIFNASEKNIEEAWLQGAIHYGQVSGASVGYTLKYMTKEKKIPVHSGDDRVPEFSLMSKGLGSCYITDKSKAWHHNDMLNRMYIPLVGGQKIAMPRYYKDKMYETKDRERIAFHAVITNEKRQAENDAAMIEKFGYDYYRVKVESDQRLFEKMFADSKKDRNIV